MSLHVRSCNCCWCSSHSQCVHEISLSWQYALLLPCCVRPHSSPPQSIGTPWDKNNVHRKLRCWRRRSFSTSSFFVGPSSSQFHERLWLSPSLLFSPLASLCFSL